MSFLVLGPSLAVAPSLTPAAVVLAPQPFRDQQRGQRPAIRKRHVRDDPPGILAQGDVGQLHVIADRGPHIVPRPLGQFGLGVGLVLEQDGDDPAVVVAAATGLVFAGRAASSLQRIIVHLDPSDLRG